jgi:hypothetical protein
MPVAYLEFWRLVFVIILLGLNHLGQRFVVIYVLFSANDITDYIVR